MALKKNDYAAAGTDLREILELAPGWEDALVCFFNLCRAEQNMAAAEAVIRRVVSLNPNHFWAINELTLILLA
ncbi:MAG: pilus assembly protein, partial [Acidocella sp.]|nr:pilus assembly protein [Acidocella sp.]